jgi:hypothetical protein
MQTAVTVMDSVLELEGKDVDQDSEEYAMLATTVGHILTYAIEIASAHAQLANTDPIATHVNPALLVRIAQAQFQPLLVLLGRSCQTAGLPNVCIAPLPVQDRQCATTAGQERTKSLTTIQLIASNAHSTRIHHHTEVRLALPALQTFSLCG